MVSSKNVVWHKISFPSPLAAMIIVIMIITVVGDARDFVWR